MNSAGRRANVLEQRINGLRHRDRLTLHEAADFVEERLGTFSDAALRLVIESVEANKFPAHIEPEINSWQGTVVRPVDPDRSTVATADLLAWLDMLDSGKSTKQTERAADVGGRPLGERERTTLLVIIAGLAKEAKIDVLKPSKAGVEIEQLIARTGARVACRTIENHLKRIPEALEKLTTP
ncbi:hypothetical protein [Paraburkholderia elongata]|uniref:Uncharacterized protein n=1 Tax=Paraburkholderia elongata TaxID=2675747 RepID=A0A972NX06_9BURK|nr:hypothetical protein [Paraburkholderia elongata]NPT60487.1 hypothetical protein [Paraburkholderia elongata]